MDLIEQRGVDAVERRLRSLNPTAPIHRCHLAQISPRELLNLGAFDLDKVLESDPYFLGEVKQPTHDKAVTSISAKYDGSVNMTLLTKWIQRMLSETSGEDLYRYKGIISVLGSEEKLVFQVTC